MSRPAGTVVVTGGAGFLGSHLVDALLERTEFDVRVLDKLPSERLANLEGHKADARFRCIQGDVRSPDAVESALEGATILYHFAGKSSVLSASHNLESSFASNVSGTLNVLRAAAGFGVKRIVFASSREVYGESVALPVEEDTPLIPLNFYGASKVAAETYCRAFRRERGLDVVILRLANIYGARDSARVIPLWIERGRTGRPLDVFGGKQLIDFLWVGYAVEAFLRAGLMDSPLPPINVASGSGTRILDLAHRIVTMTGRRSEVKILPPRPLEVTRFVASVDRMRNILGVEPPSDPLDHVEELVGSASGDGVASLS